MSMRRVPVTVPTRFRAILHHEAVTRRCDRCGVDKNPAKNGLSCVFMLNDLSTDLPMNHALIFCNAYIVLAWLKGQQADVDAYARCR